MQSLRQRLRPFHRTFRIALGGLLCSTLTLTHMIAAANVSTSNTSQTESTIDIDPPAASDVMNTIYEIDGAGEISFPTLVGSVATYWFGHTFKLDGKQYYTGFAWETNEQVGKDKVGTDIQVVVTEATYTLSDPNAEQPWSLRGATYFVGEFGAYGEPVLTH